MTIEVWDDVIPGPREAADVVLLEASGTLRDVIRSRVQQEAERFNESGVAVFRGLVQPEESEWVLNGFRMKQHRTLDWETQFARACSSFERNGFLVLVDGRQVTELDDEVELRPGSHVEFVKLVPLVGG
jgi:hypothetical protein